MTAHSAAVAPATWTRANANPTPRHTIAARTPKVPPAVNSSNKASGTVALIATMEGAEMPSRMPRCSNGPNSTVNG